jgi:hypothetical protein
MRYRLRTLLILLAVGPPMIAATVPRWQQYAAIRHVVAARQSEARQAKAIHNGSRLTAAGVRHAQLRLQREDARARQKSILYRVLVPIAPR